MGLPNADHALPSREWQWAAALASGRALWIAESEGRTKDKVRIQPRKVLVLT